MHKVLIIGEHDGKALNPATAKCVTCAKTIPDAEIIIAVFGADTAAVGEAVGRISLPAAITEYKIAPGVLVPRASGPS